MKPDFRVGTSGWTYDDWSGPFYPQGVAGAERLRYYATRFDAVEVNASFYRVPTPAMIRAWNERLPRGFHLVLKGSRMITHRKKLRGCEHELEFFFARALQLRHLEVVLWQLPPSQSRDLGLLEDFLSQLPDAARHAVEFRHPSWWHASAVELLARQRAAFVGISHPELPEDILPTTDFLYLRFHGEGPRIYEHDYARRRLRRWARRILERSGGRRVYAFFNNDLHAFAPRNAAALREELRKAASASRGGGLSSPG